MKLWNSSFDFTQNKERPYPGEENFGSLWKGRVEYNCSITKFNSVY
jgi:hypothetical protein